MSYERNYPFTTLVNYILSDASKIGILSGSAVLLLQENDVPFTENFNTPTGFTYDPLKSEFADSKIQQKDTRPPGALGYCSFTVDEEYDWQADGGTGNNSLAGGAVVSNGVVDLTGASGKIFNMSGACGFDSVGSAGCIRFVYIPNYTGNPTSTVQILEFDTVSGNNGAIFIQQLGNSSTLAIDLRDSSGVTHQLYATGFNAIQGQRFTFELNFDFDGTSRFFIDRANHGSLNTSAWTRNASPGVFKWGGAVGTGDCYLDDIIVFDSVQHTSDHAEEIPFSYYTSIYVANSPILPEMEHIGDGSILDFISFVVASGGTERYTLQIGRSGNYLYWNGSAWVVSDGSYAQANDATTFNANCGSLPVEGEKYGQFQIHFTDSDTQGYVDTLTANMTVNTGYVTSNPWIEPATEIDRILSLEDFIETVTKTGSDNVKYALYKNTTLYFHNGVAWVASDGTYSQSNTVSEIVANKSTFTNGVERVDFNFRMFLHSEDGSTYPSTDNIYVKVSLPPVLTRVYGYSFNPDGTPNIDVIAARLIPAGNETLGDNQVGGKDIYITPDASGYWSQYLANTDDMEPGSYYLWTIQGRKIKREVAKQDEQEYNDMTVITT